MSDQGSAGFTCGGALSSLGAIALAAVAATAQLPVIHALQTSHALSYWSLVRGAGDVDGDGYDDLATIIFSGTGTENVIRSGKTGAVMIVIGPANAPHPLRVDTGDFVGVPWARADYNLDGYDDYLYKGMGTHFLDYGAVSGEHLHAFIHGLVPTTPSVLFTISLTTFVETVASIPDVNADGHPDIATSRGDSLQLNTIGIFSGADGTQLTLIAPPVGATGFGHKIVAMDDINADGMAEILISAPREIAGSFGFIRALSGEYLRSTILGTTPQTPQYLYVTGPVYGQFGEALDTVGDLDGDGITDFVAGRPDETNTGAADLRSGVDGSWLSTIMGSYPGGRFGIAATGPGDLDGDGIGDFVIAAPYSSIGGSETGSIRAYSGATNTQLLLRHGTLPQEWFGIWVDRLGDVNGDGLADFGVSTSPADPVGSPAARVLCVAGRRQYGDSSSPLPLTLDWTSTNPATPSAGQLLVAGASSWSSGRIALAFAPATSTILGLNVLVDVSAPMSLIIAFGFDSQGSFTAPVDLRTPGLGGTSLYLQAFELPPTLRESNALQLLFAP